MCLSIIALRVAFVLPQENLSPWQILLKLCVNGKLDIYFLFCIIIFLAFLVSNRNIEYIDIVVNFTQLKGPLLGLI